LTLNEIEQYQICEKIFEGIDEKFRVSNHRISDLETKVDNLSSINTAITKLTILSEQNIEANKERDEIQRLHGENLIQVTNELKIISKQNEELRQDFNKNKEDNSINIPTLIKYALCTGVGVVITVIITRLIGN